MSFVSYAQNFEDVMLWRALKHVENGFYVDIGAQDPIVDSVSLAFYEHGWRGVHVEPTQQYANKLRTARPDEAVLQVAVGSGQGEVTFFQLTDTGLSTADSTIAQSHIDAGFVHVKTVVPVISMDALFELIGEREVHWLKVDVEGFEKQVLASWEVSRTRPWILVVESTKPLSQQLTHGEWEHLLLHKGYQYAYFDGLNRYYISSEHSELAAAFTVPPNIFDNFVLSGLASQPFYRQYKADSESRVQQAEAKAQQAEAKAQQAEAKAQQAEAKAQQAEAKAQQAEAKAQQAGTAASQWQIQANGWHERILAIHASTSWRITKPLRAVRRLLSGDFSAFGRLISAAKLKVKRALRPLVWAGISYVNRKPVLRNRLKSVLLRFPLLRQLLVRVALNSRENAQGNITGRWAGSIAHQNVAPRALAPSARQIYQDIKSAIEARDVGSA